MNLTKKQKIYGGVLVLAVGGVFVDRVIIGSDLASPKQASAKTAPTPSTAAGSSATVQAASFVPNRDQLISSRLAVAAGQHAVDFTKLRDGFEPAESWVGTPSPVTTKATFTEEDFQRKYPLVAVITTDGESFAVVGGRTVGVGQAIEGFKLIAVEQRTAVFDRNGTRVVLTIATKR